jgi:hypothetical protein
MPAGSTVWMKFEGAAGPDADGDDIAGSNLPGPAPPNGIPLITATQGSSSVTGYAEILPGSVRTYMRGATSSGSMHASFEDTYTIGGSAVGPFDILVDLRVTGVIRSVPFGTFGHAIVVGSAQAEIGTFSPVTEISGTPLNEGFRVTAFDAASNAVASFPTETSGIPFSHLIDITATYTVQDVSVGGTFVLAFSVNTSFGSAEIDLLNTGTISFDLPEGVTLTSALGLAVPEPGGLTLLAAGALGAAALWLRRYRLRSNLR